MTKAKKQNAIANMVESVTVTETAQGAKVKTVSTKPSFTKLEIVGLGSDIAKAYIAVATSAETLNKVALNAHEGGLRLVDLRKNKGESGEATRTFKSAFTDEMAKAGLASRTIGDYYELVAKGINSGKPIITTNPRKKSAKGGEQKEQAIDSILAKVNAHSGFGELPEELQSAIRDYLGVQGFDGIH